MTGSTKLIQYPVPSMSKQIVDDWAEELSSYTGHSVGKLRANHQCINFPTGTLRLVLMDESAAEFHWAFHVVSERLKAIAVFTEHCGHHVFPYHEAKIYRDGKLVYEQKDA